MIDYEKITSFFSEANRKFTDQLDISRSTAHFFLLNSDEKREAIVKGVKARVAGLMVIETPVVTSKELSITRSLKHKIKKFFRNHL